MRAKSKLSRKPLRALPSLLIGLFLTTQAYAAPNVRLTVDGGSSIRPRVALDAAGDAIVVWQDNRFGNFEILWQKFSPAGSPLSTPIRVTMTSENSLRPDIACDADGTSHIVWQEGESNGVGKVFLCSLDPNGQKILNDQQLHDFAGYPRVSAPSPAVSDVVYYRRTAVDQDMYYRRYSATASLVCERRFNAGTIPDLVKTPVICNASNGDAQLFWRDMAPIASIQLFQGAVTNACISGAASAYNNQSAINPSTDFGAPYVFMLFELGGNIYNFNGGGSACKLSQGAGTSTQPAIAAAPNNGYAAWRDTRDGNGEIYFCRFFGCPSSTGDVRLTNAAGESENPDIAVEKTGSATWVLVWDDSRDGNSEIYLTSRILVDAPAAPNGLSLNLTCPPAAALSWGDVSDSETRYEVEVTTDGSTWLPAATLLANTTSWTSGALAYGYTYGYRVRACNDSLCSAYAGPESTTVAETVIYRNGLARAMTVERPSDNTPTLRPLPGVRISIVRNGVSTASTYSNQATGYYELIASTRCDDSIAIYLDSEAGGYQVASYPADVCQTLPASHATMGLGGSPDLDLTWPTNSGGYYSGDGPNLLYLMMAGVRDYWEGLLYVTPDDNRSVRCRVEVPAQDAYWSPTPATAPICGTFGAGYPMYKSAMLHELAHRMIMRKFPYGIRAGVNMKSYPEVAGMDEGFADYFAAAATGNSKIYIPNKQDPMKYGDRDIGKATRLPWCDDAVPDGTDPYYVGKCIAGALWDLRDRLHADHNVEPYEVDRVVYGSLSLLQTLPATERTVFVARDNLLSTTLGSTYSEDVTWAFDRHNIGPSPQHTCRKEPGILSLFRSTAIKDVSYNLTWSRAEYAAFYRVYARSYPAALGLSPGWVVADSLTDTTFTYVDPTNAPLVVFQVAAVDSAGDEGPASAEEPLATGVANDQEIPMGRLQLRISPNPMSGTASIFLAGSGPVRLLVFDTRGRRIRDLGTLVLHQGSGTMFQWDGRDQWGRAAASGLYYIKAVAVGRESSKKVLLVR